MGREKIDPRDLELSSYHYDLPSELIAERPAPGRSNSRLLVVDESAHAHRRFSELPQLLAPRTTLVLNRSRVYPCRLLGTRPSGGAAEAFILSLRPKDGLYPALLKASGKRRVGERFVFGDLQLELGEIGGDGEFWLRPIGVELVSYLLERGAIPIPPYIRNGLSDERDKEDYQTVYARELGSVAAPTAGLHFTPELLATLAEQGHRIAYVTLHVGLGTFRPVKSATITEHQMHEEFYFVDEENAALIKSAPGPIIAVGTTALRALESSWSAEGFDFPSPEAPGATRIFLHPGKRVRSIQGLITNFHLPESSLLMLVSALVGRERVLALYREAIEERYRFFSYGDAMFIRRVI